MDVAEINQFGSAKPTRSGIGASCAQCEAMLTDAIDGTLSQADKEAFDRHVETCEICSQMLADARKGAALLELLRAQRPEPAATLLERIFAQTSGAQTSGAQTSSAEASGQINVQASAQASAAAAQMPTTAPLSILPPAPTTIAMPSHLPAAIAGEDAGTGAGARGKLLAFRSRVTATISLRAIRHTFLQPRLAMTAAMAFFSVALTLNLTGVHLNQIKAADLKPSSLKRSVYAGGAHVVRYYENLRVVYEMESRVNALEHANENDSSTAPKASEKQPADDTVPKKNDREQKQNQPQPGGGTSQRLSLTQHQSMQAGLVLLDPLQPTLLNQIPGRDSIQTNIRLKTSKQERGLV